MFLVNGKNTFKVVFDINQLCESSIIAIFHGRLVLLKIFFCLKILFLAFTPKQRNGGGNGVPLIHIRQNSSLLPTTRTHLHSPPLSSTHLKPAELFLNLSVHTHSQPVYTSCHADPPMKRFSYFHLLTLTHDTCLLTPNHQKYSLPMPT